MPWGGRSTIAVTARRGRGAQSSCACRVGRATSGSRRSLFVREEAASPVKIAVNGSGTRHADRLGYVTLNRVWKKGDTVEIEFPIE